MNERKRTAALALRSGATQVDAGKAVQRSARTLRDWLRDDAGFRELAQPPSEAPMPEADIGILTPRAVLEHLLHNPHPEIRLRAADLLSKMPSGMNAPGAPPTTIYLGSHPDWPCYCDTCMAHRITPLLPPVYHDADEPDEWIARADSSRPQGRTIRDSAGAGRA